MKHASLARCEEKGHCPKCIELEDLSALSRRRELSEEEEGKMRKLQQHREFEHEQRAAYMHLLRTLPQDEVS